MNFLKRCALLFSYALLLLILHLLFIGIDMAYEPEWPMPSAFPVLIWAALLAVHHVYTYRHLNQHGRCLPFLLICILIDVMYIRYYWNLYYIPYKTPALLWIAGLRLGSTLPLLKNHLKK